MNYWLGQPRIEFQILDAISSYLLPPMEPLAAGTSLQIRTFVYKHRFQAPPGYDSTYREQNSPIYQLKY
jgi:hypothetical protein